MPNAAESLQMTMNPYLMGGSSITSSKPLMVFTGTDPEYSVEDYLNAVTANLILNIGPEPINTPLHQNWIHRRTALIQTTLDGAAQKWFSVLPIEIKSIWKRFTQDFSKMFDSERNKQQQRVLCNEIRRLPNETIKQLAVRIETLVRKAYSLNTHDYKNTKMTEILMMTLTPQLRKIAIKKKASHTSSIREPDLDFRKLVDKLEQVEITMKLEERENLTDKINLSGPQTNDSKYTINQVFDLHDPLDTIPLSKLEIENIFLPPTEKITINTLKQYQNLDPVIRQLKSWHKYKTKPVKADTTILGNKTLLRYFRKFNNTTINENTDLLEYQLNESTVPCLPLSMILIAFNISHTQNIKGHSGSEKTYSNFIQNFYFPNAPIWIKVLCKDCIVCQLNKPYPNQKQIAQKQDFKDQSLYFNHRISFNTKGPISPSSEGNSYIMVIVDAFTHYVALNQVPHCNAYYAYTTLYEHWIAKFGLPEVLVTDNGTEFINNEIITLCHLYNIKHKPRTSHAPWKNGLVDGMSRSLQEYLRCIINGNDTRYTEWSADVKLFPLAYN